ncbi:alpha/beta fold hydrolase [Pendulispora brunnea]|uniref:Alpha/beta fold hydrolase n=1 Tax=Pendulispora brunnea TaxID=2905690 RepID=A0ABZ2KFT0_9BACT
MGPRFAKAAMGVLAIGMIAVSGTSADAAESAPSSGFNDWSCRPSAAHPNPVVLLHGLFGNGPGNFSFVGPYLALNGYCTFAPTYGQAIPGIPVGGSIHIADSAKEIAAYIEKVRTTTGAAKVDIVGHSEGGFHSIYGPKMLGYADKVGHVVALAPPTHGTTFLGLVSVGDYLGLRPFVDQVLNTVGCHACSEIIVDGAEVKKLEVGAIAQPGIDYTIIVSKADPLVVPHENSFIKEEGVKNVYLQDTCPFDPSGHIGLAFDLDVAQMIGNALDPDHPRRITCSFGPPI